MLLQRVRRLGAVAMSKASTQQDQGVQQPGMSQAKLAGFPTLQSPWGIRLEWLTLENRGGC